MKLSIVLPVYGVEKYIRQCVLSIIEQDGGLFKDIELIIVNDGTKDRSIEQIEDLISYYPNIYLINQENQGLSVARNNGVAKSTGEYIWFVDSDDWISSNALQILMNYLDGKSDIIVLNAVEKKNNEEKLFSNKFKSATTMDGVSAFRQDCALMATAVLLVCRKEYLEQRQLEFMPGVLHEDNEFCPRASYYAKQITFLPDPIYIIRRATNDGRQSITTSVNPKRAFDSLKVAASLKRFCEREVKEYDVKRKIDVRICSVLNRAIEVSLKCEKDIQRQFDDVYYSQYRFLNKSFASGKLKNKVEYLLFSLFPHNVSRLYGMLQDLSLKGK